MRQWLVSIAYVIAGLAAGSTIPRLEYLYFPRPLAQISVASAQQFLGSIGAGMIALTGIVFSIGFVIMQTAGSAYSPRLAGRFARDPIMFNALGIFICTFVYALATLWEVDRGGNGYVPTYSTYVVLALLVLSMVALVLLIISLAKLHITNALELVAREGRNAIDRTLTREDLSALQDGERPVRIPMGDGMSPEQIGYYHGVPRVVVAIDRERLVKIAADGNVVLTLTCAVGDTLTEGIAVYVARGAAVVPESAVLGALDLRREREPTYDPKYAIRILVDIAIRALSPAVNDPTTAVEALDQIEDLLERIGRRRLEAGYLSDGTGTVRLVYPAATWDDYLALSFDEIRLCSATQIQVLRRLRAALLALEAIGGSRGNVAHEYLLHVDHAIETSGLDADDRAAAHRADRQGLGMSR